MSQARSGFAVGGTDIPRGRAVLHTSDNRQPPSERRVSIRGDCRVPVAHDDDGQATRSRGRRGAGVVHVLDMLGNLINPLVRRGQLTVDCGVWRERKNNSQGLTQGHRRRMRVDSSTQRRR